MASNYLSLQSAYRFRLVRTYAPLSRMSTIGQKQSVALR